ncbi:UTP--glucose-1-phosphate uridylyltransferase [Bacillus timonensis]|nr:UTP--glucose-1-phosphate uridylyltransferase [Bacillus timonensis]
MIKKAIIPAAGYGTRSLPITKVVPKEMFPIGVKPAIQYVVEEALDSGIEEILIVVSRTKNIIVDYFDHSQELESFLEKKNKSHLINDQSIPNVQLHYTRQPFARGLGDAVRLGETFAKGEPFAVLLPDDIVIAEETPALKQLMNIYDQTKNSVIGLNEVKREELKNYGVATGRYIAKQVVKMNDIVEKPTTDPGSNLAVIGRYIFTPTIFTYLNSIEPGVGGEYQLTDAIKCLFEKEKVYGKIVNGKRYDIGKEDEYIQLVNHYYNSTHGKQ